MEKRHFQLLHNCPGTLVDLEDCNHFVVFIASSVAWLRCGTVQDRRAWEGVPQSPMQMQKASERVAKAHQKGKSSLDNFG